MHKTHGGTHLPEYKSWTGMRDRIKYKAHNRYHLYKKKGVKICDRWLNSFANFYADMGPKPSPSHSIDRIDNLGNYCPENCRWATPAEQSRNTTRNKPFYARSPIGRWYRHNVQIDFAKEHHILHQNFHKVLVKKRKTANGWQCWFVR